MMSCKVREERGCLVVYLSGDIDLAVFQQTRKTILSSLEKGDLFVDLSAVDYLDSSGVAILVEGYQISKDNTRRFGLVNVSRPAMKVIQLAHLDKLFPIYNDLQDAVVPERVG